MVRGASENSDFARECQCVPNIFHAATAGQHYFRRKAISAELDNIQMLSDLPEWGELALRSRRVEMDVDVWREIRAAQGKRGTTSN